MESTKLDSNSKNETSETEKWIRTAQTIESAARVLIDYAFAQAAQNSCDDKTIEWLRESRGIDNSPDISLILRLCSMEDENAQNEDIQKKQEQELIMKVNSKIEKLEVFIKYSTSLLAGLKGELSKINEKD